MRAARLVCNIARTHAVKVGDDLIENPQTLNAPVIDALLSVEIRKIRDGCKHYPYFIIPLAVQLLHKTNDLLGHKKQFLSLVPLICNYKIGHKMAQYSITCGNFNTLSCF